MENRRLSLPEQRNYEYALKLACKLAKERLANIDLEQQCRRSGARYQAVDAKKLVSLEYLNQSYQIVFPDAEVSLLGGKGEVPLREKVLILHYLLLAKGTPLTNKLITYKELPEGHIYFPTFSKRAIKPLVDYFGKEPTRLMDTAEKLGGHRADYGDAAVTIKAFEHVPVTLVLWQGDDEFAPAGSMLFDSTIVDYLSTEDITVLCETIAWRLVRILRETKSPPSL